MSNSSLKGQIARLGPVQSVERVSSGEPADLALTPRASRAEMQTVSAALELARRGIPLLKAKRAMDELIERGRADVCLPVVEDTAALIRALEALGIGAAVVRSHGNKSLAWLEEARRLVAGVEYDIDEPLSPEDDD